MNRLLALLLLAGCGPDVSITKQRVDADGDGYEASADCDDADAETNPSAPELCDGTDNDCDGEVDEDATDAGTWYADADGDGYGDPDAPVVSCDDPAGAVADATDCDDDAPAAFPGNPEVCDGVDNDCDGTVDDDPSDPSTFYVDADGDGYGDPSTGVTACEAGAGEVEDGTDCDDSDGAIHPDAPETDCADPVDYNCDGSVGYDDADGDGVPACEDCDDADAARSPYATEVCDEADTDEDCDGAVDDDDASVTGVPTWYRDVDGDGYATGDGPSLTQCDAPTGYAAALGDCDDTNAAANPGAAEVCDAADTDEDCDGDVDDADASVDASTWSDWYRDGDGDGHGDPSRALSLCDAPAGYVATDDDCDDTAASISPSAAELCDAADVDEDCDGLSDDDDGSATGTTTWYRDADADGYGGTSTFAACDAPSGYVATSTDCNDGAAGVNPGATEVCDAANVDEDCDGLADDADSGATGKSTWYRDADADGYGGTSTTAACDLPSGYLATSTDCDDGAAGVNPGASEVCDASNTDEDCDGLADDADPSATGKSTWYRDADSDGYGGTTSTATCDAPSGYLATSTDCDDGAAAINPGASEVCDTLDNDCDTLVDDDDPSVTGGSTWYADLDLDGYGDPDDAVMACEEPAAYVDDATDCDDTDPDVNPLGTELYGNAVDEDCDGDTDPFTITCSGASVPGTYATLTAALAAGAPVICLAEGTYTGNYSLSANAEIIGAGQGRTILTGSINGNDRALLLSHLTVEDGITEPGGGSILEHVTATCTTTSYAIYITMVAGEDILIDSVDASCASGDAIYATIPANNLSEVWLTVQNSWLHDSTNGLYARLGGSSTTKKPYLYVLGNTVTNNFRGLREVTYGATNCRAQFYNANNVIYGNQDGIYQYFPVSGTSWDYSNALYDNADDYAVEANPGVGDVTTDPLLDFAFEPPIPGDASPLIDAGTIYYPTDLDYWETVRSTSTPTIGAIER